MVLLRVMRRAGNWKGDVEEGCFVRVGDEARLYTDACENTISILRTADVDP